MGPYRRKAGARDWTKRDCQSMLHNIPARRVGRGPVIIRLMPLLSLKPPLT
jgi:hypothetical protein